jgi:acetylornithine deacetylase
MTADELLKRMVALDSSSRAGNRTIADLICDYVDGPGVRVVRNPAPQGDKLNLLIARGPRRDDRAGLILSGHLDTVPFDEPDWETDPLVLVRRDDRYLGRGVCDMKGFVALAVHRFAGLQATNLRQPLFLLLTYDEELGTLGARHFVETWTGEEPLPRAAVIGEPTSLGVVRTHKGHLRLRLELLGRPGHSAYPESGHNAIEIAARVVDRLGELKRCLVTESPPDASVFDPVPYATLNVATISGGVVLNVIPGRCVIELGIRLLPGTTGAGMVERVRRSVELGLADGASSGPVEYRLDIIGESPAMSTSEAAPIHRSLCRRVGQRGSQGVAFASDAGWLRKLDLECVLCGPGSIQAAHRANEWLPAAEFERAGDLLDDLINEWCETDPVA